MNRIEMVERVAEETGTTKASTERYLNSFLKQIQNALANGESVSIRGFGKFEVHRRAGRRIRDLSTGEFIQLPSAMRPRFVPGTVLKDLIEASVSGENQSNA